MTDQKEANPAIAGKKVLIIEDDTFLGSILVRHMLDEGFKANLIATGDNAIEAIKTDIPDILILDILLPGVNGLDILELVRNDVLIAKLPVLVVSNTDQASDRKRAKDLGAVFLLKALATPKNIVDQVREMLAGNIVL